MQIREERRRQRRRHRKTRNERSPEPPQKIRAVRREASIERRLVQRTDARFAEQLRGHRARLSVAARGLRGLDLVPSVPPRTCGDVVCMSLMAQSLPDAPLALPVIAPTEEAWRAMSPSERESFLVRVLDALSDPVIAMSEGRRHKKAKTRTIDALNLHFNAIGRAVYLANCTACHNVDQRKPVPAFTVSLDAPQAFVNTGSARPAGPIGIWATPNLILG